MHKYFSTTLVDSSDVLNKLKKAVEVTDVSKSLKIHVMLDHLVNKLTNSVLVRDRHGIGTQNNFPLLK